MALVVFWWYLVDSGQTTCGKDGGFCLGTLERGGVPDVPDPDIALSAPARPSRGTWSQHPPPLKSSFADSPGQGCPELLLLLTLRGIACPACGGSPPWGQEHSLQLSSRHSSASQTMGLGWLLMGNFLCCCRLCAQRQGQCTCWGTCPSSILVHKGKVGTHV